MPKPFLRDNTYLVFLLQIITFVVNLQQKQHFF